MRVAVAALFHQRLGDKEEWGERKAVVRDQEISIFSLMVLEVLIVGGATSDNNTYLKAVLDGVIGSTTHQAGYLGPFVAEAAVGVKQGLVLELRPRVRLDICTQMVCPSTSALQKGSVGEECGVLCSDVRVRRGRRRCPLFLPTRFYHHPYLLGGLGP